MKRVLTAGLLAIAAAGCKESPVDVVPNLGIVDAPALAVGQGYAVPRGAEGIRIPGAGEFVLIPFAASTSAAANFAVRLSASGIGSAAGPPNPSLAPQRSAALPLSGITMPGAASSGAAIKARIREVETRELTPLLGPRAESDAGEFRRQSVTSASVPVPGALMQFNVRQDSACVNPDVRTGRVVAVSQRTIVVADTANPRGPGTFSDDEYRAFGTTFDQEIWPFSVQHFGEPHDVDNNGRTIIFFTRAVNELTPRNQDWYVGGFFFARDLFPKTAQPGFSACQGSNYAEMMYMLVPDPQGTINGNRRTKENELSGTVRTLAHEFQHLINASRRLYVVRATGSNWNEQVWLNEGLSHVAEELMTYSTSSLAPRQNIDHRILESPSAFSAFVAYSWPNVGNFARYLENPDTASLMSGDNLTTRGATWHFLRYAADRKVRGGGTESAFWRSLIDTRANGLDNLRAAMGEDPLNWIQDWLVAVYADDAVSNAEARFVQPTWNLRSIYPALGSSGQPIWGRYPLKTRTLAAGTADPLTLRGGSAAYFRFGVAASGTGEVVFGSGGAGVDPAVRFTLVRTR